MSRKVILYIATSLDGYIATEDDNLQWLDETESEGDAGYSEMYQSIDTTIMGKRTYDWIIKHIDTFPYPDKKNYVFSHSEVGSTKNVEFINENVIQFVHKLKQQEGSNIWMVGGSNLLHAFMKENLIDEYIISVTPHILGSGIPLFKAGSQQIDLVLLDVKRYGQFTQVHYKVKTENI